LGEEGNGTKKYHVGDEVVMHGDSKPLRKWTVQNVSDDCLTIRTDDQEGFQMMQQCCQVVQPHYVTPYSECFTAAPAYPLLYQSARNPLGHLSGPHTHPLNQLPYSQAAPAIAVSPNFYIGTTTPSPTADDIKSHGKSHSGSTVHFNRTADSLDEGIPEAHDLKHVTRITKIG
jgi:hypothetical protein